MDYISHFFDSLFYILNASESLEVEVFLKDPNFIYNPTPNHIPPILKFSISTDAFNTLRDNEIELLRKTMEATATDDLYMQKEFSMLSFFGTFRAIILNINKYYKKSKAFNLVEPRTKKIEGNYLHYNEKTKQTMAELEYIYTKWYNNISPKGYFFTEFVNPLLDLITERTNLINQIGYPNIRCTNPLLKVILFKILSVSESKYLIEKKLIEQMKSNNETLININNVIETHMLGRKINLAMSINSEKYLKFQQLHSKYRNLINDYSHSTIRMVPPYLSMSVYELSQLVSDIDLL